MSRRALLMKSARRLLISSFPRSPRNKVTLKAGSGTPLETFLVQSDSVLDTPFFINQWFAWREITFLTYGKNL